MRNEWLSVVNNYINQIEKDLEEKYSKGKFMDNDEEAAPEEDKEMVRNTFNELNKAALDIIETINSEDIVKEAFCKITAIKDFISLHAYHLQNYEMQGYMENIRSTEAKFQEMKEKLPKKEFLFKNVTKIAHTEDKKVEDVILHKHSN